MKTEAQGALDELFNEKLIPFRLTAYIVSSEGHGIYTVHFFKSRLPSVKVSWKEGQSFRETVRAAVLNDARTSGPSRDFWRRRLTLRVRSLWDYKLTLKKRKFGYFT
jgi:hypothetical protein